ncbi:phage/plasmid primase, P4 family [Bythopirellula polymerisocia]|uniref:SF3 helicase domain-containing protein n=1 Tax=Bythopirellula polymerisocia TaxID=2528003 RepID=A0A5C6CSP9_9BACT|nr:phage/plasmid primase, P4 family [Bythopirellula polymerisocia]TWU27542.1 hypothetical protein Pla144_23190 [Bythopirellula polymerisocia]
MLNFNDTISTTTTANRKTEEPFLSEAHRKELAEGSGLTMETIRAAGYYTETNRGNLAAILNRSSYPASYGAALVIPYYDSTGTVVHKRVKPNNPPKDNKGKLNKYLQPSGVPNRAYIPQATRKILSDPTARLVIGEGEKKTDAATQAGFPCIGLPGVECWHSANRMALLPDLARIAWKGREVFIAFDSDTAENEQVERAARQLAAVLKDHGAKVRIVRIPPAENGDKQGIDDFIVAQGAAEFQKLLQQASEPESPESDDLKGKAKNADPGVEADYILAISKIAELSPLRFWRGGWWWWCHGRFQEKPVEEVRAQVVNLMNDRWLDLKSRIVGDVVEHLKAKSILPTAIEPTKWLGKAPHGWKAADCLATRTEVVHLPSLVDREALFSVPASPAFFTTTAVEFSVDLDAPPPQRWLAFLNSLWADDLQSIQVLQEIFGYLLTTDTSQQKMFMLVGPKRSGKGTIARVLTALVGQGNVVSPTLSSLTGTFGLQPLLGKSVAVIADARMSGRTDQAVIVERLLSITGEDTQTIERKYLTTVTCKLPTRFLILSNELPRLNDASGAVISRFIMLTTNQSFYGAEDHNLIDKLLQELPGIFLWAIGGWQRLRERGRFVQPDSSLEALGEMNDLSSPVAAFVRDCCRVGPGEVVSVADMFAAWKKWCETQGRDKYVSTIQTLGRDLLAVEPRIRRAQPRDDGGRVRVYQGIGLQDGF